MILIEVMGVTAIAVVSLQIAQTIAEEEVVREAHVSAPTRVRRFLSRFIVVIAIALAVEALVGTMKALHDDMTLLPHAAASIAGVALLIAAWGYFIRANRVAEDIEPEAMARPRARTASRLAVADRYSWEQPSCLLQRPFKPLASSPSTPGRGWISIRHRRVVCRGATDRRTSPRR